MKWVSIALVLGVATSVYTGHVPLSWVVYSLAAVFVLLGGGIFYAFFRNRHRGLLLLGMTYVVSAFVAVVKIQWWPLAVGFAVVWVLRGMGLEPEPEQLPVQQAQSDLPLAEDDKKG